MQVERTDRREVSSFGYIEGTCALPGDAQKERRCLPSASRTNLKAAKPDHQDDDGVREEELFEERSSASLSRGKVVEAREPPLTAGAALQPAIHMKGMARGI